MSKCSDLGAILTRGEIEISFSPGTEVQLWFSKPYDRVQYWISSAADPQTAAETEEIIQKSVSRSFLPSEMLCFLLTGSENVSVLNAPALSRSYLRFVRNPDKRNALHSLFDKSHQAAQVLLAGELIVDFLAKEAPKRVSILVDPARARADLFMLGSFEEQYKQFMSKSGMVTRTQDERERGDLIISLRSYLNKFWKGKYDIQEQNSYDDQWVQLGTPTP